MDDVRAVMDAVGSERAVLFGVSEGGPMSILFAATYPERTSAWSRTARAHVTPGRQTSRGATRSRTSTRRSRTSASDGARSSAPLDALRGWGGPSAVDDTGVHRVVHDLLAAVGEPRRGQRPQQDELRDRRPKRPALDPRPDPGAGRATGTSRCEATRYIAEHIPGARYVELPGDDHIPWIGDDDAIMDEIQRFVRGVRDEEAELDRVLATVLFTDIVGSTETAARPRRPALAELLEDHHTRVRALLARYRGQEVDTAGDGFLATFDGPARAIRCATAATAAVRDLGIEIRAGLHTGECEVVDDKVGGIAVHIGARVAALAGPSEVLVSQTVKDLVAGSGLDVRGRRRARAERHPRPLAPLPGGRCVDSPRGAEEDHVPSPRAEADHEGRHARPLPRSPRPGVGDRAHRRRRDRPGRRVPRADSLARCWRRTAGHDRSHNSNTSNFMCRQTLRASRSTS